MQITVITAITGNKDELRTDFKRGKADFVAFVDKPEPNELWETKPVYNLFKEPRRNAKIHKVLPHLWVDTDISIWIDGNISLNITPEELVDKWLVKDKDISTWKHFGTEYWWEECINIRGPEWDKAGFVDEQYDRYEDNGMGHKDLLLSECNVIVRRHTEKINRLNERWWAEICRGSSRDQISFNPVFQDEVHMIVGDPREHPDFNYKLHAFVEKDYARENGI